MHQMSHSRAFGLKLSIRLFNYRASPSGASKFFYKYHDDNRKARTSGHSPGGQMFCNSVTLSYDVYLHLQMRPQNSQLRGNARCQCPPDHSSLPATNSTPHPSTPPTSPSPFLATINRLGHINYVAAGVRCLSVH